MGTSDQVQAQNGKFSRRGFISGVGATAAGAVAGGAAPAIAGRTPPTPPRPADRFGRMFPDLPPFVPADDRSRAALIDMGKPGGLLDARDPLDEGPIRLITNPELSPSNRDNPFHTAGTTFLGQFLDHDMTFDTTSPLGVPTPPGVARRTPARRRSTSTRSTAAARSAARRSTSRDRVKLRIESGGLFEDVPRDANGTAIIADPRNDENVIISGLQAAFILAHNRVVDQLRGQGVPADQHVRPGPRSSSPGTTSGSSSTSSCRRSSATASRQRHPAPAAAGSTGPSRARRSSRWSSRAPPTGSGTAWCARRTGRTWPATPDGTRVLRLHLRPGRRGPGRPGRPARRPAGAAPVHRLADVLRLRRRRRSRAAEQADRHEDLHAAVQPAARRDRQRRPADLAAAAQPAAPPHLGHPGRAADRADAWARRCCTCQELARLRAVALENQTPLWYYVLAEAELLGDGIGSARSAAASSARCSSACSSSTPTRTCGRPAELAADAARPAPRARSR